MGEFSGGGRDDFRGEVGEQCGEGCGGVVVEGVLRVESVLGVEEAWTRL